MNEETKNIIVNGVEYAPKVESVESGAGNFVGARYIGKFVIVRSYNEGVNAGTVVACDRTGVELKNCRRLWRHKPLDTCLSWYEGVALSGLSADSRISAIVSSKLIIENYSMTVCTEKAEESIMEFKVDAS